MHLRISLSLLQGQREYIPAISQETLRPYAEGPHRLDAPSQSVSDHREKTELTGLDL